MDGLGLIVAAVATLALVAMVVGLAIRGSGHTQPSPEKPNWATSTFRPPAMPRLVSEAHGPDRHQDIDLRAVKLVVGTDLVVATFTTYEALTPSEFAAPRCGDLGIRWPGLDVMAHVSDYFDGAVDGDVIPMDRVRVGSPDSSTVQLAIPRSSLGSDFAPDAPWEAYSTGPSCPPLDVSIQFLPELDTKPVQPNAGS